MADKKDRVVPECTLILKADDPAAIGTLKNRCRLLNDPAVIAKLEKVINEFAAWQGTQESK